MKCNNRRSVYYYKELLFNKWTHNDKRRNKVGWKRQNKVVGTDFVPWTDRHMQISAGKSR